MPENRTHLTASFRGEGKKFDLEFLDMAIDSTLCLPSRLQTVQAGNKRGSFKACLLLYLSQKGPHLTATLSEECRIPDPGRVTTRFWMVCGVSTQPSAAWFDDARRISTHPLQITPVFTSLASLLRFRWNLDSTPWSLGCWIVWECPRRWPDNTQTSRHDLGHQY